MFESNVSVIEEYIRDETNGKKRKLDIGNGSWSCQYENGDDVDDEDMFKCSQCKSKFHYRCTDLPPYQIARFMMQGYRKYTCEGCVDIPKDLPNKCRRDTRITLRTKHCEGDIEKDNIVEILKRDVDEKSNATQTLLIDDKDELIAH